MISWTKSEEKELLIYLSKNLSPQEIAVKFGYNINTVNAKIKHLRNKQVRVLRPDYAREVIRIEWE